MNGLRFVKFAAKMVTVEDEMTRALGTISSVSSFRETIIYPSWTERPPTDGDQKSCRMKRKQYFWLIWKAKMWTYICTLFHGIIWLICSHCDNATHKELRGNDQQHKKNLCETEKKPEFSICEANSAGSTTHVERTRCHGSQGFLLGADVRRTTKSFWP